MQNTDFIVALLNSTKLSNARVFEAINAFTDSIEETIRIMAYLTEYCDKPRIPEHSTKMKGYTELVEYNFFKDRVYYTTIKVREFHIPADFDYQEDKIYDDYYSIPREIRNDEGELVVEVKYYSRENCSLYNWC